MSPKYREVDGALKFKEANLVSYQGTRLGLTCHPCSPVIVRRGYQHLVWNKPYFSASQASPRWHSIEMKRSLRCYLRY